MAWVKNAGGGLVSLPYSSTLDLEQLGQLVDRQSFTRVGLAFEVDAREFPPIEKLRGIMRAASLLRLNWVMNLAEAADEFLSLLVSESQRHRTVVVGDDCRGISAGFRHTLNWHRIYGTWCFSDHAGSPVKYAWEDISANRIWEFARPEERSFRRYWEILDLPRRSPLRVERRRQLSRWSELLCPKTDALSVKRAWLSLIKKSAASKSPLLFFRPAELLEMVDSADLQEAFASPILLKHFQGISKRRC